MMKRILHSILIIGLYLVMAESLFSQALYFFNIDYSKFPVIKMRYLSRDAAGVDNYLTPNAYKASDFIVKENGTEVVSDLNCNAKGDTIPAQIMFLVNKTPSMVDPKDGNVMPWVKDAMKLALDSLRWVKGTKVSLCTFVGESYKETDFSENKDWLKTVIDGLSTTNGPSDYIKAFQGLANPFAMFDQQTSPNYPRAIVFVTNKTDPDRVNDWDFDAAKVIYDEAKKRNIVIFYVSVYKDLNDIFKYIPRQTGGISTFTKSKAETVAAIRKVVHVMQISPYCEVSYTTKYGCDQASKNRSVEIKLVPKDTTVTRAFTAPNESIPTLKLSTTTLNFGKPGEDTQDKTITVTNQGPEMTLQGLTFSTNGLFVVKNLMNPKKLKNGESFDMLVGYSATPPSAPTQLTATVSSMDFFCQEQLPTINIKADWFIYSAVQNVTTVQVAKTVMEGQKTTETVNCAIKNSSSGQIKVKSEITNDADGDFTIKTGGGEKTVAKDACLNDLIIEFAPKKVGSGTKTAKIHISITEPAGITETYDINITGTVIPTSVEEIHSADHNIRLSAQPNPFGSNGKINLTLDASSYTSLDLYNSIGSKVDNLIGTYMEKGSYTIEYNTKNLTNGVYYLKLINGNYNETLRIVVSK